MKSAKDEVLCFSSAINWSGTWIFLGRLPRFAEYISIGLNKNKKQKAIHVDIPC